MNEPKNDELTGTPAVAVKRVVRWRKVCDCKGTSSTCEISVAAECSKSGVWTMTATFYPMLSCDECGEPWKIEPPL
jgi:hypothetical protein